MFFSRNPTIPFIYHRIRLYRVLSFLPLRFVGCFQLQISKKEFSNTSTMSKRKRTAITAALLENITPLAQDASTDDNYDNSSGLSSPPPSSSEEGDDESYSPIEPREVIPPSTKKKAKKMTRTNKKVNTKDEDEEDEDGEYVKSTKKTRTPAAKRTKKKKVNKKKSTGEEEEEDYDGERIDGELPEERPPPVNSDYVPIPWKGRLGFVFLSCSFLSLI